MTVSPPPQLNSADNTGQEPQATTASATTATPAQPPPTTGVPAAVTPKSAPSAAVSAGTEAEAAAGALPVDTGHNDQNPAAQAGTSTQPAGTKSSVRTRFQPKTPDGNRPPSPARLSDLQEDARSEMSFASTSSKKQTHTTTKRAKVLDAVGGGAKAVEAGPLVPNQQNRVD